MYSLTIFKSMWDNTTHKRMDFDSWEKFSELLFSLSKVKLKEKKSAQLISPAIYLPNTTRANKNVVCWGKWAAVDVDTWKCEGDLYDNICNRFNDWKFICYSTASSTVAQPKFRLVFSLDRYVQNTDIKHFWHALNTEIESMGDRQTKDLSRMYYVPAEYYGSNNYIFGNTGNDIDVNSLMNKHPYVSKKSGNALFDNLPEDVQAQLIEYRKEQLNNTSIKWTNYHDCPFVNKKLVIEYKSISESGWYHKMYQLMVSIIANATKQKYPITIYEVVSLCKQLDCETGNWYENRPLDKEAQRAIEYVYSNI